MELHPISWKYTLILLYHLHLGLPSGLFPSGFPIKTLYTLLLSSIHATCPANPILLDLMTRITGEQYRSSSFSLCNFPNSPVNSLLLGLRGLHSKTLYAPLLSPMCVTRPTHLILPDLIARIMFAVTESTRCKLQFIPPTIHISSTKSLAPSSTERLTAPSHTLKISQVSTSDNYAQVHLPTGSLSIATYLEKQNKRLLFAISLQSGVYTHCELNTTFWQN